MRAMSSTFTGKSLLLPQPRFSVGAHQDIHFLLLNISVCSGYNVFKTSADGERTGGNVWGKEKRSAIIRSLDI